MPTVSQFYGIKIRMYYNEEGHNIAHFHARYTNMEAVYNADTLQIIVGDLPAAQRRLVEAWAVIHRKELLTNAERIANGKKPSKIRPLK